MARENCPSWHTKSQSGSFEHNNNQRKDVLFIFDLDF